VSKRKSYRIFLYGTGFLKSDEMIAKYSFTPEEGPGITCSNPCIYKNDNMIASSIPDMGADVPEGEHLIAVEISLNG